MTATAHAAIGISLASLLPNPLIGIPIALVSHVICDLIPHWDAGTHFEKKDGTQLFHEGALDVIISAIVSLLLLIVVFPHVTLFYGAIMVFSAQFFDWFAAPYYMFNMRFPPFSWTFNFQKATNKRLDKPWGIVTQIFAVLSLIIAAKVIQF
jgi:CBS domain containing-hemolysin-like protein